MNPSPKVTQTNPTTELVDCACALWRPRPRMTVDEWAEQFRWLARSTTAEPGKFRIDRLPYQREPMQGITTVASTTLVWATQTGKTEMLNNVVGYFIHADPSPILVVYPTLDAARTWSTKKLSRAIHETPVLRDLVNDPRSRDSGNTLFSKEFPGGDITIAGANSAPTLRGQSRRVVIQDEVDAYELNAGTEGDPVLLADARASNFADAVFVKASTPLLSDSRIWKLYEEGDRRHWFCPCPKCGIRQVLMWRQVQWPDGKPEEACYICEHCKATLTDFERVRMVLAGEWRATGPASAHKSYWLNGINRIMGLKLVAHKNYLHWFADEFLKAKVRGREALQVWTNTFLCEPWHEVEQSISVDMVAARMEHYGPRLPAPVCLLTCAVDVQKDRLELEVIGWGKEMESWGIERIRLDGATQKPDVWRRLGETLDRTWTHESGAVMKIAMTLIDSGYAGAVLSVYHFCKQNSAKRVFPCKGVGTTNAPIAAWSTRKGGRQVSIPLALIGTDAAKSTVYDRLEVRDHGPRYCHFPFGFGYDDEFFKQLTAETVHVIYRKGFAIREWRKTRDRNEALDIRAYNIAVIELLNPNWESLGKTTAPQSSSSTSPMQRRMGYINAWRKY